MINSDVIRVSVFIGLLVLLIFLERLIPRRKRQGQSRYSIAGINCLLAALGALSIKILVPVTLVGVAEFFNGWGLLHQIDMTRWLQIIISVIMLDCVIYWQHRLFHKVPLLWRMHRVHHSDLNMDATTAIRFHPVEFLLSYLIKVIFLVILGVDAMAIVIFEIVLNAASLWSHANIRIPGYSDLLIRLAFVTPDMHRVHHSVYSDEHNSNYGFCLSIWDRIFASYIEYPQDGHKKMRIGLDQFRQPSDQTLFSLLVQPWRLWKLQDAK